MLKALTTHMSTGASPLNEDQASMAFFDKMVTSTSDHLKNDIDHLEKMITTEENYFALVCDWSFLPFYYYYHLFIFAVLFNIYRWCWNACNRVHPFSVIPHHPTHAKLCSISVNFDGKSFIWKRVIFRENQYQGTDFVSYRNTANSSLHREMCQ